MPDAAVSVAYASYALTHGSAERPRFTFVCKPRFEGAFAGDGVWRGALTGNGATHGCRLIATEIFHSTTVVGGVAGGSWKAKLG